MDYRTEKTFFLTSFPLSPPYLSVHPSDTIYWTLDFTISLYLSIYLSIDIGSPPPLILFYFIFGFDFLLWFWFDFFFGCKSGTRKREKNVINRFGFGSSCPIFFFSYFAFFFVSSFIPSYSFYLLLISSHLFRYPFYPFRYLLFSLSLHTKKTAKRLY